MEENKVTDEQIIKEAKEIFANKELRRCNACAYASEDCSRCSKTNNPISKFMYAGMCKFFETNEEKIIRETREALKAQEKEEKKINHLLTMCLNCIEASMLFLEDFAERVEKEYKIAEWRGIGDARVRKIDRAWMASLKKGVKAMKAHMDGLQKQYNHFVQPIFDKVFYDKGNGRYNVELYDDHQADAMELAHLVLRYFDVAYLNVGNVEKIIGLMKTMDSCGVMEDNDFKHYNFRR